MSIGYKQESLCVSTKEIKKTENKEKLCPTNDPNIQKTIEKCCQIHYTVLSF